MSIISATFLVCGIGSILRSFGTAGFGARLPFIMVPGGAPIAIFLAIATQTDVQTAVGAVLMTGAFYFLALPVFRRLLRFFPPIVVGTMLLLVAVNLVAIYGGTITGRPGSEGFADPVNVRAGAGDHRAGRSCSRASLPAPCSASRSCWG
ncbi:solute carrier family 23 protein [Paracoccus sp. DMF-8]|uniref:solute carrier family 23 protein n=1 Tax=Paracoccus sp. DMF-8 TaxID=3019445 RepID=UPI0023E86325|nr:solute carrier family 23 protein [Paracoccus sp. DMF-8]MDF3605809.1 solute carrier family 23 protein [Paracoccus sp. DMF-8]